MRKMQKRLLTEETEIMPESYQAWVTKSQNGTEDYLRFH